MTSVRLTERAQARQPVSYRIVEDADRDYLARQVYALLGKFRRLAKTGDGAEGHRDRLEAVRAVVPAAV